MFAIAVIMWQSLMNLKYKMLYEESIKIGAENTVLAIELTTACASLGNFTQEEIQDKWIDMFLKNENSNS